jgi:hypothetical protein
MIFICKKTFKIYEIDRIVLNYIGDLDHCDYRTQNELCWTRDYEPREFLESLEFVGFV